MKIAAAVLNCKNRIDSAARLTPRDGARMNQYPKLAM
jgi:hypothetical protein